MKAVFWKEFIIVFSSCLVSFTLFFALLAAKTLISTHSKAELSLEITKADKVRILAYSGSLPPLPSTKPRVLLYCPGYGLFYFFFSSVGL